MIFGIMVLFANDVQFSDLDNSFERTFDLKQHPFAHHEHQQEQPIANTFDFGNELN